MSPRDLYMIVGRGLSRVWRSFWFNNNMDRFIWCDGSLGLGENALCQQSGVRIYEGEDRTSFDRGILALTTHRLIWRDSSDQTCILSLDLSIVVFLEEHPSGFAKSSKIVVHMGPPPSSKAAGPTMTSSSNYIRLSFRDAGETQFYRSFNDVLAKKPWEKNTPPVIAGKASAGQVRHFRSGIVGIERKMQAKHEQTQQNISVAFEDLSNLIGKAKDMVELSKTIAKKIKDKQGDITEDETIKFKSYLLSLGIPDPVTRETHGSGAMYHIELARELSRILEHPLQEQGGMMTLTDVYCWVNRARGMELLSPDDLLNACKMLQPLQLPIRLRIFDSGVMVLHLLSQNEEEVILATTELLNEKGSLTANELSQLVGVSVILAKERLLATEKFGGVCRDDSIEGLRFYPNLFLTKTC
ncbi:PREDICTED: vacuolar protein-sorting-associated protein 36-like [Priapulus caudatus]|uniref:Vacuolar protein-sorting-associated protein 36 n=1 Tax=Priapulus caudatus TaxID=37621 RepID=A0ABM1EC04_PRICU|nr:PREDICTED: vacuolar protein-sorting-associated protein 36-like [Priapulus caudatus]